MTEKGLVITDGEPDVLPAIADNTLIAISEQAEKRIEAMHKIKRMALKLTNPHDWVDENGKPYLQASGAEKVARLFGVSWRIFEPERESIEGGHFTYTYHGEFSLAGASIEAIGTRSSKDPFFKKYEWKGEGEKRTRVELPASEIDPGDVKKSAYTNLLGNGITRLLGIRNLTYEDLKQYAGINKEQIASVEYKKGGRPIERKPTENPESGPAENGAMATEAQVKAIHAILNKLKIADELGKMQKVAGILGLKEVPTSLIKLSKSQASTVIAALQKEAGGE
ncbi:MAG: hypothetical protein MUP81_06135 [Dehalococcoidia bacterium]|nr:hypothetical protein [Dehalococcoidia bacterium]